MPIRRGYSTIDGKKVGYYVWGDRKRYYYTPGNEQSRRRAYDKAERQARAIYARGYTGKRGSR